MKKILVLITIFSLSYIFNGCDSSNRPATGFEDEIYVVADSMEYEDLKLSLQTAFEVQINTPLPEKLFTLKRINVSEVVKYKRRKNIVIIAPLNSDSKASEFLIAIVENVSYGIADDNLTIPLSVGLIMWGLYLIIFPNLELILLNVSR